MKSKNNNRDSKFKNRKVQIFIDGIHCAGCVLNIENTLNKLEGIENVSVNLSSNIGTIEYNPSKVNLKIINQKIEELGFEIKKQEVIIRIKGIHCAMCVSNIEKALNNLDGIYTATVNLNTGKSDIKYEKSIVSVEDIKKVVEVLGFEFAGVENEIDFNEEENLKKDLKDKKNRIIVGFFFSAILIILMYTNIHYFIQSITNSINIKLNINLFSFSLISLIIAIVPFIYVSYPILIAGYKSVRHKILNMDVMYSMGILVAFISSVFGTFNIVLNQSFMFYETAIMLSSFLLLGRYLEGKAKKSTTIAIKKLIGLQPKTANLLISKSNFNIDFNEENFN
jgi:Cu+-exporting ATPase